MSIKKNNTKFVFVTGGVVSSLGKGLTSASLAAVLQSRGYSVKLRKLDPYLNIDPGTMNPNQHGEVFVTEDGAETDLDLGHYERFTGVPASKHDNITAGKIYQDVIRKERKGFYLGGTVQVIPHVTDAIKEFISFKTNTTDFVLVEVGGTVGDIESLPFLEAIRQLSNELGKDKSVFIHLTLVPYLAAASEQKTKPTQHSVKELRSIGIQPDILLCRCERSISAKDKDKISLFCNIEKNRVIEAIDVDTIYAVPTLYQKEGLDIRVLDTLGIKRFKKPVLSKWEKIVYKIRNPNGEVLIGIVGKYIQLKDAYKSLSEALCHSGIANNVKVKINWIDSEKLNKVNIKIKLSNLDGILVPGGFGERGTEGKLLAINYARVNNKPFFGICFGMQLAVIEIARNLIGIKNVGSSELGVYKNNIVGLLTEWSRGDAKEIRKKSDDLGGTMRLGSYKCTLKANSMVSKIYKKKKIIERHRHRYEVNILYKKDLLTKGVIISGISPDGKLPEIIEIPKHRWFIGVQFHPELISKPHKPHPLFTSFVKSTI